jgi:hypothetical protein
MREIFQSCGNGILRGRGRATALRPCFAMLFLADCAFPRKADTLRRFPCIFHLRTGATARI